MTTPMHVPFNRPFIAGNEMANMASVIDTAKLAGDGSFTSLCNRWLEKNTGCTKALLTHSCTGALEMAASLFDIAPGDEVILPSFTFVSSANAFILRGAVPVFVDIRSDTLNIDESLIEAAITPRTKAIVVVHYAGVGCEMDAIMAIAEKHGLLVVEDAAQGLMASYKNKPLGAMGHLGALSFHDTKNITSGEGGALLINDDRFVQRAEIMRDKGTNRSQFFRGEVDKYTWVDIGSSYLPSELTAAFLWAQLQCAEAVTASRLALWNVYHRDLAEAESRGELQRPMIPDSCAHNAHIYQLLLRDVEARTSFIARLKEQGIHTVFHYVPLHSSPYGKKIGRVVGSMQHTDNISDRLVRLPLWPGLEEVQEEVIDRILDAAAAV